MSVTQSDLAGGLQSVDRALQVLELLGGWGTAGVSELAAELGVHKSTVSRILGALEARELVEQQSERGKYRLGFGLARLARRVSVQPELTDQARPLVEDLAAALGESANVAVLREHYAVNVVQAHGQASIVSQNWIGQLTPLHATSSGKVLLAHLAPAARADLLALGLASYTTRTVVDPRALETELRAVAEQGWATTAGELEEGLNAVAVPVRGEHGGVVAALSVSGPAYRWSPERISADLDRIRRAGTELSRRLGHWETDERRSA